MKVISQPIDFCKKTTTAPRIIVPTMGALHKGHLELIHRARALAGKKGEVIVTIFVNPTQFNNPSDLEKYPRTLEKDLELCREQGADVVFTPAPDAIYYSDHSVNIIEGSLSNRLCGATRPGHFEGVCTVVLKLFNITRADIGVFGKKDFQQLAIIRRMVRDLNLAVQIEGVETVREPSGLALSSRNTRLTKAQHADAPRIRRALLAARKLCSNGELTVEKLISSAREIIDRSDESAQIDYLELLDSETLQPITKISRPALLATAVFYGNVRLIDNIELN